MYQHKKLTADKITDIFQVQRSPRGSNQYERENLLLSFWNDMLIDIEEGDSELSLAMILSFATGCSAVPPTGFSPVVPWIAFPHDSEADGNKSKFPKANTCALKLYLPTVHSTYNDLKNAITFAFLVHIVGVLGNDDDLRHYFLSLFSVIESTQHYLSTRSLDLLEYCQRHLEGHLCIIVVLMQVLD